MTVSELMKAMAEAGAPFEAILIAVQALDAKDAELAAKEREQSERRAKDAERKRAARANNGTRRARPRNVHGQSKECPADPPIDNIHTPGSDDLPDGKSQNAASDFPKPDWCDDKQVWADFLKNRKRKRLPNTPTAHKAFLDDIARLADDEWPPGRLLRHAAAKGWGGIYDPRASQQANGKSNGQSKFTGGSTADAAQRVRERMGLAG